MFIIKNQLPIEYQDDVWELLCATEQEFVPPLSLRSGTTQKSFSENDIHNDGLTVYFQNMLQQAFVLAVENKRVIGFLTYIPDHLLQIGTQKVICNYISTIAVYPEYRNQGITKKMYQLLFENSEGKNIATRTWSTNYAHLHLLEKMNFTMAACLQNDRGQGIDTVYYVKEVQEK